MSLSCPSCGAWLEVELVPQIVPQKPPQILPQIVPQLPDGVEVGGVRTSSRAKNQYPDPSFHLWWKEYPRHVGKASAFSKWVKVTREVSPNILIQAAIDFAAYCRNNNIEEQFIPYPERWLNRGSWEDELAGANPTGVWSMPVVGTPEYDAWVEAEERKAMEL